MKRKLLTAVLVFSMCSVPFSAYADEEVTVDSVVEKMNAYSSSVESSTGTMTMNLDAALKIVSEESPESSFGISVTGGFDMKTISEPMQVAMTGSYSVNALGQSMKADMEMYLSGSEDNKTIDTYVNMTADGTETGWQHTTVDYEEMLKTFGVSSMQELSSASIEDILGDDVDLNWELSEEGDNYLLSASLNFSDLMPLIETSMESAGAAADEEEMDMVKGILESFKMNMTYTLDKETCAPLSCHVDFNDSDLSVLNDLLVASMMGYTGTGSDEDVSVPEVSLELNDFSMDMTMSYNDVDEILIPAEALAADTVDVNELVSEAE